MADKTAFTVREVAQMLSTSEETVRRWIRDGKLIAHHESRKEGNQITEAALKDFFSKNKKYRRVAEKMASMGALLLIPGIGPRVSAMFEAKIATDEAIIDRAKKFYEANKAKPNSSGQCISAEDDLAATAENIVKNAQDGLYRVQSKLKSARERRQELEKEIEELESQEQLIQDTLKIVEQTLADVSKLSTQSQKSDSED